MAGVWYKERNGFDTLGRYTTLVGGRVVVMAAMMDESATERW